MGKYEIVTEKGKCIESIKTKGGWNNGGRCGRAGIYLYDNKLYACYHDGTGNSFWYPSHVQEVDVLKAAVLIEEDNSVKTAVEELKKVGFNITEEEVEKEVMSR